MADRARWAAGAAAAGWMERQRRQSGKPNTPLFRQAVTFTIASRRRDERFQDFCNQGVNAESFLYNAELPAQGRRR